LTRILSSNPKFSTKIGLKNLGNTVKHKHLNQKCFMNSTLQCLVNIQEFRQLFTDSNIGNDSLLKEFQKLIHKFQTSNFSISPKTFHDSFVEKHSFFEGFGFDLFFLTKGNTTVMNFSNFSLNIQI
jgi:ubiquitin C-terminal hydrolase